MTTIFSSCLWWALLLLTPVVVQGRVACFSIFDCSARVSPDSECINGFCSNPYYRGGCLANRLPDHHRVRTCHSEDPPQAAELGYCRPSPMDYTEIRISSQNWESVFFEAWILQILLSELFDVPVTLETGYVDKNVDFYDLETSFDYGSSNDWQSMRTAHAHKDCRKVKQSNSTTEYVPCAHVVPEVWTGHTKNLRDLQDDGVIEPPAGLGALGSQGWYIPRFTAQEDPTLLTYLGMMGEENRHKLAATFLRPTTWLDYCQEESPDQCQTPNKVAERPPVGAAEEESYFQAPAFNGYFRNTTENDCVNHNDTCTGHIVDYPCGWSSYVPQQAHHLNIAVESNGKEPGSNGYSYSAMTQIWAAANATQSNVMLHWWQPEALYQEYLGTNAEFQRVSLPPATQDCVEQRVNPSDRCSDDPAVRVGDALGSCDEAPHVLFKIMATALYDISFDPNVPLAMSSPAYDAVKDFRISDLQVGRIFDYWFEKNTDKWGLDPRDAVCDWAIEHLEELKAFIPRTHPRVVSDNDSVYDQPLFYAALAVACVIIAFTVVSILCTYIQRNKKILKFQQIEFLILLLMGLLLVSVGSLLNSLPPTDGICVSVAWFVNVGYTLELVPLIVKVAAINRLMVAAQQMRRVELNILHLYGAVLCIASVVGVGLIIWTVVDPPQKSFELTLTNSQSQFGETRIERTHYCQSDQDIWQYLSVSWQLLLLLCASVLAFQTRKMQGDINDTRTLAMMVYSHFVFVVLRAITYFMGSSVDPAQLAAARTFMYSADVAATLCIYFVPKFFRKDSDIKIGTGPMTTVFTPQRGNSSSGNTPPLARSGSRRFDAPQSQRVIAGRVRNIFSMESSERSESMAEVFNTGRTTNIISHHERRSNFGKAASLRQLSDDYKTQAQWEDSDEVDPTMSGIQRVSSQEDPRLRSDLENVFREEDEEEGDITGSTTSEAQS